SPQQQLVCLPRACSGLHVLLEPVTAVAAGAHSQHSQRRRWLTPAPEAHLSVSSSSRVVTHDIPVKVIPRKLWKDLQEPTVPDADVSIYLPVLKTMKSIVEKMKNISNHLIIEANLNGELNLKIETELVCVTTHFKDLENPPLGKFPAGLCFAFVVSDDIPYRGL
ncbi:checkpoint protein HUS1-like, partial [Physeter macrocephalus]|uniref:Checkpoint protein HUS1-like n=1 Tax=Physeter macrocephalus TaxID=9755 RepID=A0A2Y9SBR6_PHYMC